MPQLIDERVREFIDLVLEPNIYSRLAKEKGKRLFERAVASEQEKLQQTRDSATQFDDRVTRFHNKYI